MNQREIQQVEKISEKIAKLRAQRSDIQARDKKRQRKERTQRLIRIGALTEKYFDMKDINPFDYENFLKSFLAIDNINGCVIHTKQHILHANTKGESES